MEVFRAPHFPVAKTLEEELLVGKLLTSALKTIPSVTCKQNQRKLRESRGYIACMHLLDL